MTLKNAALLALVGTLIIAALRVWDFIFTTLAFVRGAVSAAEFLSSLIYDLCVWRLQRGHILFRVSQTADVACLFPPGSRNGLKTILGDQS